MAANQHTVFVIGGPTASGKSGLAVALAEKVSGAVINADSMQLYRGLPVLTAQPPREDRDKIPHLLYDALAPGDACSAARWRDMALAAIDEVIAAKRVPIVVGGTGLYLKALVEGLSPLPEVPPEFRARAIARQKELGNPAFHAELQKLDPAAEKLDPFNTQRLVRAREVLEATGKSIAEWQALPRTPPPGHLAFVTVALLPPRDALYRNCDARFGQMLEAGGLEEAAAFLKKIKAGEVPETAPLAKALGFPELRRHLEGLQGLEEAATEARLSTRRYAKRQVTWFRHQMTPDIALERPDAEQLTK